MKKKNLYLVSLIFLLFSCNKPEPEIIEEECFCCNQEVDVEAEGYLKVMTLNIGYDFASDGINIWFYRKPYIEDMLQSCDLDIFGTQEDNASQLADLKKALPAYSVFSTGIGTKYKYDFHNSLFFKTSRFDAIDNGYFWLHPDGTPEELAWGAKFPRIATWVILKDKSNNLEFLVIDTHFDHYSIVARFESAKLILQKVKELANDRPYIVMGDLNDTPNSEPLLLMNNQDLKRSKNMAKQVFGSEWTFHNWGKTVESSRTTKDYVLISPDISVRDYRVIDASIPGGGVYLSDHCPVYVELKISVD